MDDNILVLNVDSVHVEIPEIIKQVIQRVPPHFKNRTAHSDVYDPVVVSLGPYHHGKPQLRHAELYKQECLEAFVSESPNKDKSFFYSKVLGRIHDIRECYEEVKYDDETLAWLILHDACFLINYMCITTIKSSYWSKRADSHCRYFGAGRLHYTLSDLYLFENQIPFWIMKFLLQLLFDEEGQSMWKSLLRDFMDINFRGYGYSQKLIPADQGDDEHFHFLEAVQHNWVVPVEVLYASNISRMCKAESKDSLENIGYHFRSVTHLKEKGIHFKVTNPTTRRDSIRFTSHLFYGLLELPSIQLSTISFTIFSNIIAYEMCYTLDTHLFATSFVNFMKSLIETPNDVKILREHGILINLNGSDEEIVKLFRDIDTFGVDSVKLFAEVRATIGSHCCSKAKTRIGELLHTYFRSPWSTIALLATIYFVCSTFLQTFFAIRQAN